ncbi:MAG: GH116 family glycosyl-hydrolase, partial [Planctomycetota bacterium]
MSTCPEITQAANGGAVSRRDFTKCLALGAAGLFQTKMPVMAGPFASENEYLKLIPSDKRLDPAWVRSLVERGKKETYSDLPALRHIGMPVGGLFAGTVYLSGDGRLWLWDIFNRDQEGIDPRNVQYKGQAVPTRNGANYLEPAMPKPRFAQGFSIRFSGKDIPLNSDGFTNITFQGEYPRALIAYHDESIPVAVELQAFSPFIPLNVEDSSLPVTIMQYTVKNTSRKMVSVDLIGHLQNAVCLDTGLNSTGLRRNRVVRDEGLSGLVCEARPAGETRGHERPDILYEDFEKEVYEQWTSEGESFGKGPIAMKDIPDYQGDVRGRGKRVVNSHSTAPGANVREKDQKTGTLTSKPFKIERRFISFLIGGGAHQGRTCINLLVDGKVVASQTGKNGNQMEPGLFHVERFEGREAVLQIIDKESGGWGNIGVDQIVLTDKPTARIKLQDQRDFGNMVLALLGSGDDTASANSADKGRPTAAETGLTDELVGEVGRRLQLKPGATEQVTFAIAWYFPNFYARGCGNQRVGHHYTRRFASALDVTQYLRSNLKRLAGETRLWVETWYDSTLPYWFLDRTMANTSVLATTTCYRFKNGRVWAWEGIGCCAGTCTHVWQYAQAPGRLFPEVERIIREQVDLGLSIHADGGIGMRANLTGSNHPAHDGQCGRILGAYREHQMSRNDAFLRRIWPNVKRAMEYMIKADGNEDGMVEGAQANTL